MEEIKHLYKELKGPINDKQRKLLWIQIIQKNRKLLQKRMKKVKKLMGGRTDDLAELSNGLQSLVKDLSHLRDLKPEKRDEK